ncbi:MAG: ATP-dependent DNA helicase RecG [Candidatus Yanofskybacteria bacterium RIFCSPHIGHO2_01_FULL_44_17]|uniref:ATP-dependent DNA helicase RecG n=1 Tax=Candidatus Yanofskybacteria bacterium RIFCSPHIGHO2_01_FULL_44_17 TaxID=1802668 RepID=A0A1F8EUN3_9BACT|nr:MAG: ATP-dependent DNA helicase RecG [Candidatus Yanofskybacteria bacterium RIFCSPHIGHO2_01_FULL_44_17]
MFNLSTPIENFTRVGPKFLARLKKLGIKTARDLLWHFPARYDDYSSLLPIGDVKDAGRVVSIAGQITTIDIVRSWRRHMAIVNATIEDQSGIIRAVWFNQPYIADALKEGTMVSLSGKTSLDKKGIYLSSPSYEKIEGAGELTHTGRLVPVYPETEGLTSKYLRFLIKPIIDRMESASDYLPPELLNKYNLPKLGVALRAIHFPETIKEAESARQRFAFEEILLFQLRALRDHRQLQALKAPRIVFNKSLIASFVKSLPFELTDDQRVAAYEILQDLDKPFPMNRLLNGDVGSGKTVVALVAAYQATNAACQVVFMAPTEILAKQHFDSLSSILLTTGCSLSPGTSHSPSTNIAIKIGLLTGNEARQWPIDETETEKITKKLMVHKIANGEIDIVIGTHAVIQRNIKFTKLGLVVIDEQHRFGVAQRMKLVKGQEIVPHLLSMTATPIPRTLALTIYGDLDVSLIKEKPKGRPAILTRIVANIKRAETHKFISDQIKSGRQVFVICPRIEASKSESVQNSETKKPKPISQAKLAWAEVKAVTEEYERLSQKIFPRHRTAMLHGKLRSDEKNEIMKKFRDGQYDILVSTSVIEVGVDIPNATIMMIESAERFGLAQLHQFRGRVGRGEHQSYCFLFTSSSDIPAGQRLRALEKTDDGFQLAEADLKLRGPGEFTGIKQSGLPDIAMASLTDLDLIKKARLEARLLLKDDPTLKKYPAIDARLAEMQRLVHFE